MKRILTLLLFAITASIAYSQSITIVTPNGGESLAGCQPYNITWTESGTSNFYDIDYSTNGGVTWVSVATAINTSSGSYTWTVPNRSSTNFKIRVLDNATPGIFDESDAVFTVIGPLQLNYPNGGDSTVAGAIMPVNWSATNTSNTYRIQYSTNGGANWSTVESNYFNLTGDYNWTVPNVNTTTALVQVTDVSNACITDKSDSIFTIASDVTVTQPNGGEIWPAVIRNLPEGETPTVLTNANKEVYVYGGTLYDHSTSGNYSDATQSYTVTLRPTFYGLPVRLAFTSFNLGSYDDVKIYNGPSTSSPLMGTWTYNSSPGTRTSTDPSGALTLQFNVTNGTTSSSDVSTGYVANMSVIGIPVLPTKEIKWDRTGTSGVFNIEYSINNGAGWERIVSNYSDLGGVYNWKVPNNPTTQALVRVIDVGSGLIIDQSDAVFTIGQATPELLSPNGGNRVFAGLNHTITWEDGLFAGSAVVLEYSDDNGSTWNLIHSGTDNDGSYDWIVPNIYTTDALIRVSEFGNTVFNDVSDATFIIEPYIHVRTPNGGEAYSGCDIKTISWYAGQTSGNYRIEYSDDNGGSWNTIVTSYTASGTSPTYNWTTANITSTNVKIKISDISDGSKVDESDAVFTITPSQYVVLNDPTGGETMIAGTVFPISYLTSGPVSTVNLYYSRNNGASWSTVATNHSGGSYNWTVPNYDTDEALFRVRSSSNSCIVDESDSVWSMQSEVTLTQPNGGEVWQAVIPSLPESEDAVILTDADKEVRVYGGTLYDHTATGNYWDATQSHTVTLKPAFYGLPVRLAFSSFNLGSYDNVKIYNGPSTSSTLMGTWTYNSSPGTRTSTDPSGCLTLEFNVSNGTSSSSDVSTGYVANISVIGLPTLPTQEITWGTVGTSGSFDLEYSIDNGTTWIPIVSDYTSAIGTYEWQVPNTPSTTALVQVIDASNGAILDVSNSTFTIGQATAKLLSPNGTENYYAGLTKQITWENGFFLTSAVVIEYSTDNGGSWKTVTTGTNNDGSFDWIIPEDPSTQALVRVSEFGNPAVNDVSDANFTLSDYIVLTSPAGGENLFGCETMNIRWNVGETSKNYKIEYSDDNGGSWNTINGSYTSSLTSIVYPWTLPNINTTQLLVKVSDRDDLTVYDSTSVPITLSQSQYLSLVDPTGGEDMIAGTVFPISYITSGPVTTVNLYYSRNNGASWSTVATNHSGGSYNWTVPNYDTDEALFRVRSSSNSCIVAESDSVWSMQSEVSLSQPNGGEVWQAVIPALPESENAIILTDADKEVRVYGGTLYDHTASGNYWDATQSHTVTLKPAFYGLPVRLAFSSFNLGSYDNVKIYNGPSTSSTLMGTWTYNSSPGTRTSTDPSGCLTLEFNVSNGTSSSSDVSTGYVANISVIGLPTLPTQEITWGTIGTSGSYDLEYSIDNGTSWIPIIDNYTSALGTYDWQVPNTPSTLALVRVSDAGNGAILDVSDANFTIGQADRKLLSPNGGQNYYAGLTKQITWEDGLFVASAIVIEYSTDNGSTWKTITTGTNNDGSFDWIIPQDPSTQALVRVSEFGNPSVNDVSDANFTLSDYIVLTSPAGGESLFGCETMNIRWNVGETSQKYRIEYSDDNGASWNLIISNYASSLTSVTYPWTLPNINTTQLLVKVSDRDDLTKVDSTSVPITLNQSQYLSLTDPTGGENMIAGTVFPISYITSGPVTTVNLYYSRNNGANWSTVATNHSGGSYNWTVPNYDTDLALFRVQSSSNSCIVAESDSVWSMQSEVDLTQPNGGEVWQAVIPSLPESENAIILTDADKEVRVYGGTLYDHTSSGNYWDATQSHTVTLKPAFYGLPVRLAFSSFNLGSYDNVKIYNGPSTSSTLMGTWTYNSSPGTRTSTDPSGCLTLEFNVSNGTSSSSDVSTGYVANISVIGLPTLPTQEINWGTIGTSGSYDLDYSIDNGASWIPIIDNYTSALGTYDWQVPNTPSTLALVRVSDAGNGAILDISDANFTIGQGDTKLLSPNGGQNYYAGLTKQITWEDGMFLASAIVIEYSTDNGSTWKTITTGTNNDGSFDWIIPQDPSTQALVRVSEFGNPSVNDVSDANFTLSDYIVLTSPAGGESLFGCETMNIRWNVGETSQKYRIEYSDDNGVSWNTINSSYTSSLTSIIYPWTLPNINTTQLLVKVSDRDDLTKVDSTSVPITLNQSQYLSLTDPTGGENMIAGTVFPVSYITSGPVSTVNLYYSRNNGASWTTVATNHSGGSYNWTVPNYDTDLALFRVRSSSNSCIVAESDSVWSMQSEVDLTQPDGGEVWQAVIPSLPESENAIIYTDADKEVRVYGGTLYDHTSSGNYWDATQSHTVTLKPAFYGLPVRLAFSSFNLGSYDNVKIYNGPSTSSTLMGTWTYNSSPGTRTSTDPSGCLTLEFNVSNGTSSSSDVSTGYVANISVLGLPTLPTQEITWGTIGTSGSYDLEYSIDNGTSWIPIADNYTTAVGSYDWQVPNTPSTLALVRVSDAGNGAILDVSNGTFTIGQAATKVLSPNGGEDYFTGATKQITWEDGLFVSSAVVIEYSTDSGATWKNVTTGTNNDGSFDWIIPQDPSQQALVRVSEFGTPGTYDISDAVFELSDFIELTSPVGGENLFGCETMNIRWNVGQTSGNYKIEYSADNGLSWNTIVSSFSSGLTSVTYNWVMPNINTAQLKVRVSDAADLAKSDEKGVMNLTSTQYVNLSDPTGGENMVAGTVFPISYSVSGPVSTVNLYYSRNNGASWSTVATNHSGGSYNWTVPNYDTDLGLFRVRSSSNSCILDQSDSVWSMQSEVLVTQANGGEVWQAVIPALPESENAVILTDADKEVRVYGGTLYDHTASGNYWDATQSHTVTLKPAFYGLPVRLAFSSFNLGSYDNVKIYNGPSTSSTLMGTWTYNSSPGTRTSTDPSGCLTLEFNVSNGTSSSSDVSTGYVANITVLGLPTTLPTEEITWVTVGTSGSYDIDYSIDNGISWIPIVDNYTTAVGSYLWRVPNTPSTQALIRVKDAGNGAILDYSDANFTIGHAEPQLLIPNGGEEWFSQATYNIEWEDGLFNESAVTIEYSIDDGSTWQAITTGTNNDGSYDWLVPDFVESYPESWVRVREFSSGIADTTDTRITLSPAVQVFSPNGGGGNDSLRGCTQTTIIWKAGGTTKNYRIEYTINGGTNWNTIESSYYSASLISSYNWTIPNLASADFFIRVSDAGDLSKHDVTDNPYAIRPPITVITPNFAGDLRVGATYPITWESDGASSFYDLHYSNNGGSSWIAIAINENITNSTYNWTVPNDPNIQTVVRVTDNIDNCKTDVSDNASEITPSASAIEITAPFGGESWVSCGDSLITWNSNGVSDFYDIEYSDNGGASWNSIETNYFTTTDQYLWTLPSIASSNMIVRVTDATDLSKSDNSDGPFELIPFVSADVTPSGPTTFCAGGTVTLTSSSSTGNTWSTFETTQSIVVNNSGVYTVTVTSGSCTATSLPVTITVNPVPSAPSVGVNSPINLGDAINLTASSITDGSYAWSGPSGFTSAVQNPSIANAQYINTGNYDVVVTVDGCSSVSASIVVNVGNSVGLNGVVRTEEGSLVNGVTTGVSGYSTASYTTSGDGYYEYFLESGQAYSITPVKTNDVITNNGVTTLDLILMQRHILGVQNLPSAYRVMAADVDLSNTVTTLDIVLAQSVILQTNTTFPGGRLWSFVSSSATFADPMNPFPYSESRDYASLGSALNQDFVAMKLGDVNGSWNSSIGIDQLATSDVHFGIDHVSGNIGDIVTIPVRVRDFNQLSGYQFTMSWDADALEFVEADNKVLAAKYGLKFTEEGRLTTSWHTDDLNGKSVADGAILFELKMRVKSTMIGEASIAITSDKTAAEAYTHDLHYVNVIPYTGGVSAVTGVGSVIDGADVNFETFPNPFMDHISITFDIEEYSNVKLSIVNGLGQEVYRLEDSFVKGSYALPWNGTSGEGEAAKGVYWVSLEVNGVRRIKKVVKL